MYLINFKWRTKGKEKCQYLRGKKNLNVYVLMCCESSGHGIRLETRMFFYLRSHLFLSNTKVSLNYYVGAKEKRPKQSYRNQEKDSEAEKL